MKRIVIGTTLAFAMERRVLPQVPALCADGWVVDLVCSPGLPEVDQPGCSVRPIPMGRGMNPAADRVALRRWVDVLDDLRPDIVMAGNPKAGLLGMLAAKRARVPIRVLHVRGSPWETATGVRRTAIRAVERRALDASTDVLAVSSSLAELLVKQGQTERMPVVLGDGGSVGVDLSRFTPRPADARRPLTVGYLGRLAADKGLAQLVRAFDLIQRRRPDARLLLAGRLDDRQPLTPAILDRLASDRSITWLGDVDDVPSFFGQVDVMAFPSSREGLPNAVIEAAAAGVPTVGWDVTGVRDAVRHGVTGYLCPPFDVEALAWRTLQILEQPRGAYCEDCLTWAHRFDQRRLTRLTVEYLDGLLERERLPQHV
jgi:glycosyltransferase involved in cell wall biosynthesis